MRVIEGLAVLPGCCVSHVAAVDARFGEPPPLAVGCPGLSVLGGRGGRLGAVLCVVCARGFLVVIKGCCLSIGGGCTRFLAHR